jgi:protein-disulfide isomerase
MRTLDISFITILALASAECARPENGDDWHAGKPEAVAAAPKPTSDAPAAVRVPIDGLPVFGNSRALVTIVAFTDYDCPFCAKAEKTIAALRTAYGDDLRVAIASRPLPMHDRAAPAARAFLAAVEQGKGEAMHTQLFATQGAHDDDGLRAAAQMVGLDARTFENSRTSLDVATALSRSEKLATTLGVKGTPTFFVNGRRITGAQSYADFATLIDEEIERAHTLLGRGVAASELYAVLMASALATPPPSAPDAPAIDPVALEVGVDGAPIRGSSRAPVTVVMFSDFECPYCVKLETTLKSLEDAYPGKVRLAFRHHPLPMHEHARLAAKASMAADAQGKFWQYHDALVAHRDALDRASLERYASDVGLDVARFSRDLDDARLEARLTADEAQATQLRVQGTPTTFVQGHRITGAQPLAIFKTAVDNALTR